MVDTDQLLICVSDQSDSITWLYASKNSNTNAEDITHTATLTVATAVSRLNIYTNKPGYYTCTVSNIGSTTSNTVLIINRSNTVTSKSMKVNI